jgi:hypothetical protein
LIDVSLRCEQQHVCTREMNIVPGASHRDRKWTNSRSRIECWSTCTVTGTPSAPSDDLIITLLPPSSAEIPREHHAQLPHHTRSRYQTAKSVGAVENG